MAGAEECDSCLHAAPTAVGLRRRRNHLAHEEPVPLEGLVQEVSHQPGVPHHTTKLPQNGERRFPFSWSPEDPQAPREPPSLAPLRAKSGRDPDLRLLLLDQAAGGGKGLGSERGHTGGNGGGARKGTRLNSSHW